MRRKYKTFKFASKSKIQVNYQAQLDKKDKQIALLIKHATDCCDEELMIELDDRTA